MTSSFKIPIPSTFRLDYTVWALRRRPNNIMDNWDGQYYQRVFVLDKKALLVTVNQVKQKNKSFLRVSSSSQIDAKIKKKISNLLIKMLGIAIDLKPFYKLAAKETYLKMLVKQFKGVKPVRFESIFEALVNAIACQQLSLNVGIIILNRLSEKFGKRCQIFSKGNHTLGKEKQKFKKQFADTNKKIYYSFPTANRIQRCKVRELKALGFSTQKSKTIIEISKTYSKNPVYFETLSYKTKTEIIKSLSNFKGIGRWSAEYTMLRGFGRIDIFPGDDVGAQNNLKRIFHISKKLRYEQISKLTRKWHPYEGFVYFHLLLDKLSNEGFLRPHTMI